MESTKGSIIIEKVFSIWRNSLSCVRDYHSIKTGSVSLKRCVVHVAIHKYIYKHNNIRMKDMQCCLRKQMGAQRLWFER